MRAALTLLMINATIIVGAQPFERIEVVNVDSTRSAADLYRTAERWFVDNFKDAQEVIQLRDTVTHTVVGKGAGKAIFFIDAGLASSAVEVWYTYMVEVSTKDGRYRLRIYDAVMSNGGSPINFIDSCCYGQCDYNVSGISRKQAQRLHKAHMGACVSIHAELNAIPPSLKAAMVKPKEDW